MIRKVAILIAAVFLIHNIASAQTSLEVLYLTSDVSGGSETLTSGTFNIQDDGEGVNGNYSPNCDYTYTVVGACESPMVLSLRVELFDIHPTDTVYIYDGPTTNSPLLIAANNSNSIMNRVFYVSSSNAANAFTIRIKTNYDSNVGQGFSFMFNCKTPCATILPVVDNQFFKTINGEVVATANLRTVIEYDTAITITNGVAETTYIQKQFQTANICEGECLILQAHGQYTDLNGSYTPSDANSTFKWSFGNNDTLVGAGLTRTNEVCYDSASCFYVTLSIIDQLGCRSEETASLYVRIAPNPISQISPLPVVCASDSIFVSAGYDEASIVSFNEISIENTVTRTNSVKTFIPDGPNCPELCYEATVTFNEFPEGSTITSGEDICSVCINFEHSFMGDYRLSLKCPNGQIANLKYGSKCSSGYSSACDPLVTDAIPEGAYGGSATYTGYPYGGNDDYSYDNSSLPCDSLHNMYGVGLDYCFSRNGDYTLADGYAANTETQMESHYIACTDDEYEIDVNYTFDVIPRPYEDFGTTCGTTNFTTKRPSNHDSKTDYYMPADDFANLIGCPLNGDWKVVVCDFWNSDNGWVFSWSMDLCNEQTSNYNCQYNVKVDTLYWTADSSQGDYYRGEYRGLHVYPTGNDDYSAYVTSIDTGGVFDLKLTAVDEFGCNWDTILPVTTNPLPRSVFVVNKCPEEEYTWVDGITYTEPQNPRPVYVFPAATGCDSLVSLQIINDKIPEARITALPAYVSYESSEVTLYDASIGSYYRTFYFDDETSTESPATFTYPIDKDSLVVMMVAESYYHCVDTAYITIPMDQSLIWVPNAFTPSKDDNSQFFVKGHNILDDIQVYIYNRNGALVSSWVGFSGSWDGYHNGTLCGLGAYTWVVKYHTSFEPSRWHYKTGTVSLLH